MLRAIETLKRASVFDQRTNFFDGQWGLNLSVEIPTCALTQSARSLRAGLQVHMIDADDQGREVRLVVAVQIRLQGRVLVDLRVKSCSFPSPSQEHENEGR